MKRTVLFAVALMLICALVVSAQQGTQAQRPRAGAPGAAPGGMMGGMMGGGMMGMCPAMASAPPSLMMIDRNAETLGLTADQKTKLTAALTRHDTNLGNLRTAAQQASKALHDAIYAPTFDSAKVNTLLAAAQKADAAISTANVQSWTEIRSILTPAQVAALSEATTRRMGGFGGENRQDQNRDRARPGTGGARGAAPDAQ